MDLQASPELLLEMCIIKSAADNMLSAQERKRILRALQHVDINSQDLIGYGFYLVESQFPNDKKPMAWLREFVSLASQADLPKPFLAKGVWFSPGTEIRNVLLEAIRTADKSLDVCVYNFTDDRLANALVSAIDRGVPVTLVTERSSLTQRGSQVAHLESRGAKTLIVERSQRLMHHKFVIVDGRYVLSGSYNWTLAAMRNFEDVHLISEASRVSGYVGKFAYLFTKTAEKR